MIGDEEEEEKKKKEEGKKSGRSLSLSIERLFRRLSALLSHSLVSASAGDKVARRMDGRIEEEEEDDLRNWVKSGD